METQKVTESEALYCTFGPGVVDHEKGRPPDFIVNDGHVDRIQCVAFSADCTKVASGSSDETVCVWNVKSGEMIKRLAGYPWQVYSVSWDGDCVIAGSHDKTVRIWNIVTGDVSDGVAKSPKGGVPGPRSAKPSTWSPDHGKLASPSTHEPYDIIIWDYKTEKPEITMSGHTDRIISVCWSPDGTELASGSWDMTVRVWNAATGAAIAVLAGHTDCVTSVAFSADGGMVASASWDKTVRLWDSKAFAGLSKTVNSLSPAKGARSKTHHDRGAKGKVKEQEKEIDWSKAELPEGWERLLDTATNKYFYVDHERKRTQWRHPLDSKGSSREWVREDCIRCNGEEGVRYFGIGENVKGFYFGDPNHCDFKSTNSKSPQRNRSGHLSRSSTPSSSPSKSVSKSRSRSRSRSSSPSTAHKQRGTIRGDERKGEREEKLTESEFESEADDVEPREEELSEGKTGGRGDDDLAKAGAGAVGDKEGKHKLEEGDHREDEDKDGFEEEEEEVVVDSDKK